MVCPGCLRDVTGLVGPDDLLCPECVAIPTEELMPSLLESLAALDEEEAYLEHDEYWEAGFPTFQGRPRF